VRVCGCVCVRVCVCVCVCVDDPSRRTTLALYCVTRALDDVVRVLVQRGVLPSFKYGSLVLFTLCQAPIMVGGGGVYVRVSVCMRVYMCVCVCDAV